jgi:hypothetical protein
MENYTVKSRVRHNKEWYNAGDTIALTPKEAEPLIADGAIDPNGTPIPEPKPDTPIETETPPKSVSVTDSEKPSTKKPAKEA